MRRGQVITTKAQNLLLGYTQGSATWDTSKPMEKYLSTT